MLSLDDGDLRAARGQWKEQEQDTNVTVTSFNTFFCENYWIFFNENIGSGDTKMTSSYTFLEYIVSLRTDLCNLFRRQRNDLCICHSSTTYCKLLSELSVQLCSTDRAGQHI